MYGNKFIFLFTAFAGIILWNTPNTVSLFADTHAFYNGSAPCQKCHGDILAQLEDTGSVNAIHRNLDNGSGCRSCHSNPVNISGRNATEDYHSAYRPECIECHQNVSSINSTKEAHSRIVRAANNSPQNVGLNEACVMCHTTVIDEVTIRNRVIFPFENDSIAVNGSVEYGGTYTTTMLNPEPNGLHNYNSGVQCIMCHAPVQDIISQDRVPYSNHIILGCKDCHRNTTGTQEYHAAKIVYCSDCHDLNAHQLPFSRDCNECHESHGGLKGTELNSGPSLISWGNNLTNDQALDLTVNANESVNFNATATQAITSWTWLINGIDQNINSDNFTTSFSSGTNTITVTAANLNGTSNTIPWTVTVAVPNPPPSLISWGNNLTNDQTLDLTVNANNTVTFNATADQAITSWNWLINDIDQNINSDTFTTSFSSGTHTIKVNASNLNGTSNTIPWTVTVQ